MAAWWAKKGAKGAQAPIGQSIGRYLRAETKESVEMSGSLVHCSMRTRDKDVGGQRGILLVVQADAIADDRGKGATTPKQALNLFRTEEVKVCKGCVKGCGDGEISTLDTH